MAVTLEAVGVSFQHRASGPAVLTDISLQLQAGEFVGLVGANGSGKSTLARILSGLLSPRTGRVELSDGSSVRKQVGLVFQNPESQLVANTVEEEIAFGPENAGLLPGPLRDRVEWALSAVHLEDFRESNPQLLSAGQKQRLAIAGVLAIRPQFILLDEPTSFLDPVSRRELMELLNGLRREFGLGILCVTHHLDELACTDRMIALDGGTVALEASTSESFRDPDRLVELGLELPHPILLQRLLQTRGWNLPSQGMTAQELLEALRAGHDRPLPPPGAPRQVATPALSLEKVSYRHFSPNRELARTGLQDISLTLQPGECLGIIGPTGSGKSTLVQQLNGLLRPQSGQIEVNGRPLPRRGGDLRWLRQQVGFLFQSPERQFFEETVFEEIAFAPKNFGVAGAQLTEAVHSSLNLVGLAPEVFAARSPFELSGGERRLVALASVLAARPQILVLDEPTAGLDAAHRTRLVQFLKSWEGTRVVISHHFEELAQIADRLLLLRNGKMLAEGPARALFGRLQSFRFEPPLTSSLASALRPGTSEESWPVTLEEFRDWWAPA